MQETQVSFQDWEYALEKGMVTHSNILAWEILYTEEPGGLHSPWDCRIRHDLAHMPCQENKYFNNFVSNSL